jgi:hypothetical protein
MMAMTSEVWRLGVPNLVWRNIMNIPTYYVLNIFIKLRVSNILTMRMCVCVISS